MQQNSSELDVWFRFFKNASIPAGFAQNYAKKFVENRIRFEMLADLDRPLLNELGITAIGDCLSILKHAKAVSEQSMDFEAEPKSELSSISKKVVATTVVQPATTGLKADSNLSTDLFSRINFNPKTTVDSTTVVRKRALSSDDEEMPMNRSAAEIKSTVVQLNNNKKRVLSLEEQTRLDNISIQRRISMEPSKTNTITRLNNNNGSITRTVAGGPTQQPQRVQSSSPVKKPTSLAEKIANQNKFGADSTEVNVMNRIPKAKQEQKPYDARLSITKSLVTRNSNTPPSNNGVNKGFASTNQNKNIVITLKNELATEKNRKVVPIALNKTVPKATAAQVTIPKSVVRPATVGKLNSVVSRVSFEKPAISRISSVSGAMRRAVGARHNAHENHRTDRRLHSRISF